MLVRSGIPLYKTATRDHVGDDKHHVLQAGENKRHDIGPNNLTNWSNVGCVYYVLISGMAEHATLCFYFSANI